VTESWRRIRYGHVSRADALGGDWHRSRGETFNMNIENWEATIQKLVEACNLERGVWGKDRILIAWWKSLVRGSERLEPFEMDEIVREVRRRLQLLRSPVSS